MDDRETVMGLLDSVLGAVTGGQGNSQQAELLRVVVGMLANNGQGGGVADLVSRFQQGGLGHLVESWIGTGQNLPVSADQLSAVLGPGTLSQIASQLGVSHGEAAGQIAQMLPHVLDKLTPQGQLPQGGLGEVGDLLGRLMSR